MKRLGLALGGGGSRALSHLGVLSVLAEENIPVHCVAGSSLGGLIAAMYAFRPDAADVRARAQAYFAGSRLFGMADSQPRDGTVAESAGWGARFRKGIFLLRLFSALLRRPALLKRNPIADAAARLLPDADIEAAALPFACNALDMTEGRLATFRKGPVREAVVAGTSIASIFPPYRWNGGLYADAAPVSSVPVHAARSLGAEVVAAVDLRARIEPQRDFRNGFEIFRRIEASSSRMLNDAEVESAEVVIRPERALAVFWGDFGRVDEMVGIGAEAARAALPELRAALGI